MVGKINCYISYGLNGKLSSIETAIQTSTTKSLDEIWGLTGRPVVDEMKIKQLMSPVFLVGRRDGVYVAMPYFGEVAAKVGNFVGVPLEEIEGATRGRIRKSHIRESVEKGYLEELIYRGVKFVAPTEKYQPLESYGLQKVIIYDKLAA